MVLLVFFALQTLTAQASYCEAWNELSVASDSEPCSQVDELFDEVVPILLSDEVGGEDAAVVLETAAAFLKAHKEKTESGDDNPNKDKYTEAEVKLILEKVQKIINDATFSNEIRSRANFIAAGLHWKIGKKHMKGTDENTNRGKKSIQSLEAAIQLDVKNTDAIKDFGTTMEKIWDAGMLGRSIVAGQLDIDLDEKACKAYRLLRGAGLTTHSAYVYLKKKIGEDCDEREQNLK